MIMIHIILNTQMVNDNVEHWSAESDGIEVWNKFLTLSSSQQRPPLSLKQKACDPYSCLCHAELHSTANATWERVIVKKLSAFSLYCLFFWIYFIVLCNYLLSFVLQCNAMQCFVGDKNFRQGNALQLTFLERAPFVWHPFSQTLTLSNWKHELKF